MTRAQKHLQTLVQAVRRQVRRRTLLQGAAITIVVFFACAVALVLLYPFLHGRPLLLWPAVFAALLVTVAATIQTIIRPLRHTIDDQQIALFIEEQSPGLEDRLNSAVEADTHSLDGADTLLKNLLDDAARMARSIVPGTLVRKVRARIIAGACAVVAASLLVVGGMNLDRIRLVASNASAQVRAFMTISPGNTEVEKGDSQSVVAELRTPYDADVFIVFQESGGEGEWARQAMEAGSDNTEFMAEFSSIQYPLEYYVEAGRHRSRAYTISVYEFPAVDQIDLTYQYPDYIPLPPRIEEDAGDIHGLTGSTVTLTAHTVGKARTAEIVLESGPVVPLTQREDGTFSGQLTLDDDDLYTLRVTDENGKHNQFPVQYVIAPLPDTEPHITLHDPGRDLRVNALEEILIAADVDDDYGLDAFRLTFFVGGGEAQSVSLLDAPGTLHSAGEHLLFLEDYSLQPGDVITYYLEAQDAMQGAATDMYFIEVIPFDQTYTQVTSAGGGNSGGQQSGLVVSQQEIIAATWRLLRERGTHEDYSGALEALTGAQANLKRSIEERIQSTAFSLELRGNELQQQTVRYLQEATESMGEALREMERNQLQDALPAQRRALTALLRADAQNKENQVAQQQRGQTGSGMSATEERMSELMDLELDISKDKYEVQQQRAQQTQELDDAARQVKDLARRQQDLNNLQRPDNLQGEERRRFVDRLRRDQEEVRQQLEQIARGSQRDAEGRMASALRNMREADRALNRGNMDEALERQQQALRDLQELQPSLERATRSSRREQLQALTQDLRDIADRERKLAQDLETTASPEARPTEEQMEALDAERLALMDDLHQAMEEAARIEAQSQEPELTAQLRKPAAADTP